MKQVLVYEDGFRLNSHALNLDGQVTYCGYNLSLKELEVYDDFYYCNLKSIKAIVFAFIFLSKKKTVVMYSDGVFDLANSIINNKIIPYLKYPKTYLLLKGKREALFFNLLGVNTQTTSINESTNSIIPANVKKKILITTSNKAYFNKQERNNLLLLFSELRKVTQETPDEFIWSIEDKWLCESLNIKPYSIRFKGNEMLYSAVITTPSTIILEAMAIGIPVCTLTYRHQPLFYSSGWIAFYGCDFRTIIEEMILRQTVNMVFQESIVNSLYSENTGLGIEEVESFLRDSEEKFMNDVLSRFISIYNINFERIGFTLRQYIKRWI